MDPLLEQVLGRVNSTPGVLPLNHSDPLNMFPGMQLLLSFKPIFVPLYCLLVAVACVGNASLLACILVDKKLYNATNFFIGNLAAGDLLMCLSCVPLTASYAFDPSGWSFGRPLCYLVPLLQAATVFASALSLTAIAADRYVVVAHPVRRRISLRCCAGVALGVWGLALALAAPPSMHTRYLDLRPSGVELVVCEEFWPGTGRLRMLYSCFMLLASYMVPLLSVSVSYCAITAHLRQRFLPDAQTRSQQSWSKKRRKTFYLLVASVLAFALCWLPLQVLNLLMDLDGEFRIVGKRYVNVLQVSCHLVAMSSACYNPFIYASLHSKLRLHLRAWLRPRHRGRQPGGPVSLHTARQNGTCLSLMSEPPGKEGRDASQSHRQLSLKSPPQYTPPPSPMLP